MVIGLTEMGLVSDCLKIKILYEDLLECID